MMALVGALKVVFGLAVAVVGILVASRVLSRSLGVTRVEEALQKGNVSMGILEGGAILALALLCRPAVVSTFTALDYLWRGAEFQARIVLDFAFYAAIHVGASLLLGAGCIAAGVLLYGALTRRIDEIAEVQEGNVAPAIAIASMMVAIALLTAPGLEMMLGGLLPLPDFVDTEHFP